jgi:PKD repeat protein
MNMFSQSTRKSICLTIFFLFFQLVLQAQQETYPCAASEMQRLLFEKDPSLLQKQLTLDGVIQQHIQRQQNQADLRNSAVFSIPVVVHIIHQNGSENISDAQVQSAIQHLNDAFAHQGYYGAAGQGTNIPIQFCLAQRTPNNQATNGITRDVSSLTTMGMETDDSALKNLNRWDPRQYINIWVVRDINSKAHGSGVAGYAYYASAHGASFDGIVCEARYFGNSPANDVVLIHEVGHYLNLYHTFEGGCTNNNCELEGDRVCDTPPDQAKHTGCVYNSCNTDTDDARAVNPLKTDVNDLTENYLDYSPFSCQHAFTPGQSARMLAALQTVRASLLDSPGCLPPCTQPIAADIVVPPNLVVGTPVTFTFNGSRATRFEWKLNGTVFSSQPNPAYTFTQSGFFTLEVIARNGDLNCWSKKQIPINVLCNAMADFTPKLMAVQRGNSLTFTSTSTAANQYEWSVNGAIVGAGTTYTHTFNADGDYTIQLKASNANCSSISIGGVVVNRPCRGDTAGQDFPCPEICDNDIDDNDDGLIDCADPTCKCEECRQLPDGVISAVDSIKCLGDSLRIYLKICNQGQGVLRTSTPIAFYKTDPTTSNAIPLAGLKTLGVNLPPDTCISRSFVIKAPGSNPIFVVFNDDYRRPRPYVLERYLSEQYPECNYRNNKFQFSYNLPQTPKLDLGPDQLVCANSVTLLRAPAGFARYRWFDGTADSTLTAFSPGLYWVDAWDACGNLHSDSIRLTLQPLGDVELGPDRNICAGDTLHLSVAGFTQLKWWPAAGLNCDTCKSIIAKPDTTTRYYVTARRGNCFAGDSVLITVNAKTKVDLGPDRMLCSDSSLQLLGPLLPNLKYQWSTGAISPSIEVAEAGLYFLEATSENCSWRDSIKITLEDCNRFAVYVPNVMSTSSTVNAQFHPFFSTQTELLSYQFDIYDRWGEMVFRSQDAQQSWDGTKNGQWCNQGVYVWTLRVRYREDGEEKEAFKFGEVLLLR